MLKVKDTTPPGVVGCGADGNAVDAYYQFTLTSRTSVTIDPAASVTVTPAYEL